MKTMVKSVLLALALYSSILFADSSTLFSKGVVDRSLLPSTSGIEASSIKPLMLLPIEELSGETSLLIGTVYLFGDDSLGIDKNVDKAKKYFNYSSDKNVTVSNLVLASIALTEDKNINQYILNMEKIVKANDDELSVPAGLNLAYFFTAMNDIPRSVEVLRYIANVYDDPRAQFMVGWSIVSNQYTPSDMSYNDGKFFIFQACNNSSASDEIKKKCSEISNIYSHK